MKVVYTRKTSDGNTVEIWEDGSITAHLGHKIPGIGKNKIPSNVLALFAEEVHLFSLDELWALHEATRRLARGGGSPDPEEIRKLAIHLHSMADGNHSLADGYRAIAAGLKKLAGKY